MSKRKTQSEIEPEEILLDGESAPRLETPVSKIGFFVVFACAVLILTVLFGRVFWLQIRRGDYYAERSAKNSVRLYHSRAPRGAIYDRNGEILATNRADFGLIVIPADLPEDEALLEWTGRIAQILQKDRAEIESFIKNLNKNSIEPVPFDLPLSREILVELEANLPGLPALFVNKETRRQYEDGSYFSQILGYTGKVSGAELKADSYYSPLDFTGKSGLETQYEEYLRGQAGKIAVSVDSDNTVLNAVIASEPLPGDNLILSIDGGLQKLLTDALKYKMSETGSPGAAAVVLNTNTGEILSLVSLPAVDNNMFTSGLSSSAFNKIINNKNRPLFNRAISGTYSSGSTIKPFIAAAALAEKVINPDTKIDDTLGYIQIQNQYYPDIIYTYRDWKAHGFVDMRRAIAVSANVYFYVVGGGYKNISGLGIGRIEKYLKLFGFGEDTGVDLPGEASGLVPSPEWKKSHKGEPWVTGDTYNVSIGQGDILVTPLQMAAAISAIANGGTLFKPRLVSKITDESGQTIQEFGTQTAEKNLINEDYLKIVREGMRGAVTEGSAWFLNDLPFKVAGKTGTAQVTNTFRKTNAWFTGFAPYDNPEIAIAVVLEGAGEGSSAAVPVAKQVFEWYFYQTKK